MKRLNLKNDFSNGKTEVKCLIYHNVSVYHVKVIAELNPGTGIHINGLQELKAKELILKVCAALQSIGSDMPHRKVTVTIGGAWTDGMDSDQLVLPVAIAIYARHNEVMLDHDAYFLTGDLTLNGSLNAVPHSTELTDMAQRYTKKIFLPKQQYLQHLSRHQANAIPVDGLKDIIDYMDKF